jgi:hypothetical protein
MPVIFLQIHLQVSGEVGRGGGGPEYFFSQLIYFLLTYLVRFGRPVKKYFPE